MGRRLIAVGNRIFRGTIDNRLRASWRIVIAVGLTFVGALGGVLVVQRVAIPDLFVPLVAHLFAVLAVLATAGLLARYIDHRQLSDYGFSLSPGWGVDAVVGVVIGIGLVGLAFGLAHQRGVVTTVDTLSTGAAETLATGFGVVLIGWVFVGLWEETLFRGLFLENAAEGLAVRDLSPTMAALGAWLSSSLVYGFLHGPLGSNPDGVSLLYALVMTSVMGGLFGLAYLLSNELALPIGLHTGINLAEQNIFFGPPGAVGPAVVRAEHAVSGARLQFQSLDPIVIVPVFVCGYLLVAGWAYLRDGRLSVKPDTVMNEDSPGQ
ncbi:CPBP family intramembrane glutamic endopeptidase [Halomicroarcula sp. GCM10025817]|uniref:CPBP family intramembrane glutamic endopeptidase n=1 Tax=Haloarcula TaxID=2237 RepID=UPI0023E8EF00|nr:type II CAAX endopeptidase family protein [Halomicroarcula sp. SYNS111]